MVRKQSKPFLSRKNLHFQSIILFFTLNKLTVVTEKGLFFLKKIATHPANNPLKALTSMHIVDLRRLLNHFFDCGSVLLFCSGFAGTVFETPVSSRCNSVKAKVNDFSITTSLPMDTIILAS